MAREAEMARPERFELPTARFVAEYSIQLSYGRIVLHIVRQFIPSLGSSALRCKVLASTLRVSAPATRQQARGVRFWPSLLGLDASRQSALTRLTYGRIV